VTGRVLTRPFVLACLATFGALLSIGMLIPVLPVFAEDELGAGSIGVGLAVATASPTALLLQLMMIVVSAAPEAERSEAVGSFTAFADLGYALGAVSLGAVAAAAGYSGVYAVAAILVAAGLLPLSRVRHARLRRPSPPRTRRPESPSRGTTCRLRERH
jgi:predicted MFS family arabinose efflux permease